MDIRIGVTRWSGAGRWPKAGFLYLSTDAEPDQIAGWLSDAAIPVEASGTGDGPVASGLPIMVPDLTRLAERKGDKFPEDVLRKIIDGREAVIVHGTRYMPVWGYEFWVEEGADAAAKERVDIIVDNLVEYIRSIQRD